MSEREQAIEKVANTLAAWDPDSNVPAHRRERAEAVVDALASQPVVERQITEEMVERALSEWECAPTEASDREAMRAVLEAALGAPSQETGER